MTDRTGAGVRSSRTEKGYGRQKMLSSVKKRKEFIFLHGRRKISFKGKISLCQLWKNEKCPSLAVALLTLAQKCMWKCVLQSACVRMSMFNKFPLASEACRLKVSGLNGSKD